jgi:uncharacterized repeat protein (TIGR03803 family)
MQATKSMSMITVAVTVSALVLMPLNDAQAASTEQVLHSFQENSKDGLEPYTGLVADAAGNLYGTTEAGGTGKNGTVFELIPGANGKWTEKVLRNFPRYSKDGYDPTAGLAVGAAGNLYGTTFRGGDVKCMCGVVFELSPGANGKWQETVLHSFIGSDGSGPNAPVILDGNGNLYGTSSSGGTGSGCTCGTVFKLSPSANRQWTETVLHNFSNDGKDGFDPVAGVVLDAADNVYGTTYYGGTHGIGMVFELSPHANGSWTETIVHEFGNGYGTNATGAGVILDAAGNLYGTTFNGGAHGDGTVFESSPGANGNWSIKTLHSFNGKDGYFLVGGLVFDTIGNLYGTTDLGGLTGCTVDGCGVVFELSPGSNGTWTEKVLHKFRGNGKDGFSPRAGLIVDSAGNLYGTTTYGGTGKGQICSEGCGTVFKVTP